MHVTLLGYGTSYWDVFPDPCSGRELQVWGIARELAHRGHEVTLLKAGQENGLVTADGVDIISLANGEVKRSCLGVQDGAAISEALSFSRMAAESVKDLRPDVLCLHYGLSSYHLSDLDVPRSYTFHVADVMASARRVVLRRDFSRYPHEMFKSLVERKVAQSADRLVVLNGTMEKYVSQVLERPVQVIPCGVDESSLTDRGDHGYVLYAGRMEWNKNVGQLVKAYAALPASTRREHPLKLLGAGEDEIPLRDLVRRLGIENQVDLAPWANRERLASIVGSCSVLVLPSLVETFGIVLIEAMACGKPVLATDIPGPRDVVLPGETGYLVAPDRVGDMTDRLQVLLEDPLLRRKLGEKGRSEVEARYTFQSIGDSYEKLLKGIIREGTRSVHLASSGPLETAPAR
ncbi:MAG: glycosyltransferase family 4 protein [Methanomassiliicoccus sp.]|nr:glycosyltransferase family 4 protein [Methanomassiliicoccus sp.]